jgi:hypothetical protein
MKTLLVTAIVTLALAAPASAQLYNNHFNTVPLGNGFQSYNGTIGGQSFSGNSVPLGNGFQSYNYSIGGQQHSGMSIPLGNGFYSYSGQ